MLCMAGGPVVSCRQPPPSTFPATAPPFHAAPRRDHHVSRRRRAPGALNSRAAAGSAVPAPNLPPRPPLLTRRVHGRVMNGSQPLQRPCSSSLGVLPTAAAGSRGPTAMASPHLLRAPDLVSIGGNSLVHCRRGRARNSAGCCSQGHQRWKRRQTLCWAQLLPCAHPDPVTASRQLTRYTPFLPSQEQVTQCISAQSIATCHAVLGR